MTRLLQGVLGTLLLVILIGGVACTSTAAPDPAASAPATKPAASDAARIAQTPSQAVAPNDGAAWKADWDNTVAAAIKEGKIVIAGGPSELYRNAAMAFQKAYPEIQVEFSGIGGAPFATRVLAERQAGQYLWDTCHCGWNSPLTMLNPAGALDPLKPQLLLPEVLDDSKWRDGLNANWADKERQKVFEFEGRLTFMAWVNRKMASDSELRTVDQLVDPKWKGKIAVQDPRVPGVMSTAIGYLLALKGEDWVRKLLEQDLIVVKEGRQQAEGLVRESYPIAMGVASADFEQFARELVMPLWGTIEHEKGRAIGYALA